MTHLTTRTIAGSAHARHGHPGAEHQDRWERLRGDLHLVRRQIRFEQRAFWRNRSRAIAAVALPLMFLVVFNAINGGHRIDEMGGITYATWFVPGILAYGLIMATFANVAVGTSIARDSGVLKRTRITPLPSWVFLAGAIGSSLLTAAVLVTATLGIGVVAYGVRIPAGTSASLVATLALGAVCCAVLGLAATSAIRNAQSANAMVNLVVLPLTFISGIWFVLDGAPRWLELTAEAFPVRAIAHSLQHATDPATVGSGFVLADMLTLVAWTVFGALAFLRWFRWEPFR